MAKLMKMQAQPVHSLVGPVAGSSYHVSDAVGQLAGALGGVADQIYDKQGRNDQEDAVNASSQNISNFVKENKQKREYTAEEARSFGITDDTVLRVTDDEGNKVDNDRIPAHLVYPQALDSRMKTVFDAQSQNIGHGRYKKDFITSMENLRRSTNEKETLEAIESQQRYDDERRSDNINEALENDNIIGALKYAEGFEDANVRNKAIKHVELQSEINDDKDLIRIGDVDDMRGHAEWLRSEEYKGEYSDDVRTKMADEMDRRADIANSARIEDEAMEIDIVTSDVEIAISRGEAGIPEIEAHFEKYYDPDKHVNAEWRTRMFKSYDQANRGRVNMTLNVEAVYKAMAGKGTVDRTDGDIKKAIDYVDQQIIDKFEIVEESPPNVKAVAMRARLRLAAATGLVPTNLKGLLVGASNAYIPPEMLKDRLQIYTTLTTEAPNALDFMSDIDKLFMETVHGLAKSNNLNEDSLKEIRDRSRVGGKEREYRNKTFDAIVRKGENKDWLQSQLDGDGNMGGGWMDGKSPFWHGVEEVRDGFVIDFEAGTRHYYQMGGDIDAARATAYADMTRVYGKEEVNGGEQFMRRGPQKVYGLTADQSVRSKNRFLTSVGIGKGERSEYIVGTDIFTDTEKQPSYPIFHTTDEGRTQEVMMSDGVTPLRWRPSLVEEIAHDKKIEMGRASTKHKKANMRPYEGLNSKDLPSAGKMIDLSKGTAFDPEVEKAKSKADMDFLQERQDQRDQDSFIFEQFGTL